MPGEILPFLVAVALLTVMPGPDMALVLRNGAIGGAGLAWRTGIGCCTGIAVHATAAVIGLSVLLALVPVAFTLVRLAGAGYLIFLGGRILWLMSRERARDGAAVARAVAGGAATGSATPASPVPAGPVPGSPVPGSATTASPVPASPVPAGPVGGAPLAVSPGAAYRQGLFCNLLNPKIALLFLTLLPQFVAPGEPRLRTSAVLAAVFLGVAVLWWGLFAVAIGWLAAAFSRPRVRRVVELSTGLVLIALGVRVAFAA